MQPCWCPGPDTWRLWENCWLQRFWSKHVMKQIDKAWIPFGFIQKLGNHSGTETGSRKRKCSLDPFEMFKKIDQHTIYITLWYVRNDMKFHLFKTNLYRWNWLAPQPLIFKFFSHFGELAHSCSYLLKNLPLEISLCICTDSVGLFHTGSQQQCHSIFAFWVQGLLRQMMLWCLQYTKHP